MRLASLLLCFFLAAGKAPAADYVDAELVDSLESSTSSHPVSPLPPAKAAFANRGRADPSKTSFIETGFDAFNAAPNGHHTLPRGRSAQQSAMYLPSYPAGPQQAQATQGMQWQAPNRPIVALQQQAQQAQQQAQQQQQLLQQPPPPYPFDPQQQQQQPQQASPFIDVGSGSSLQPEAWGLEQQPQQAPPQQPQPFGFVTEQQQQGGMVADPLGHLQPAGVDANLMEAAEHFQLRPPADLLLQFGASEEQKQAITVAYHQGVADGAAAVQKGVVDKLQAMGVQVPPELMEDPRALVEFPSLGSIASKVGGAVKSAVSAVGSVVGKVVNAVANVLGFGSNYPDYADGTEDKVGYPRERGHVIFQSESWNRRSDGTVVPMDMSHYDSYPAAAGG